MRYVVEVTAEKMFGSGTNRAKIVNSKEELEYYLKSLDYVRNVRYKSMTIKIFELGKELDPSKLD